MSLVYRVQGIATIFGLDYDGKPDKEDNGLGFFNNPKTGRPYNTKDESLMGCSIPIPIIDKSIGAHYAKDVRDAISNGEFVVWVTNRSGKSCKCSIVDIGPSTWTKHVLDLCYAPSHVLNTNGYTLVDFEIRDHANKAIPLSGWEECGGQPGPQANKQVI